MSKQMDAYLRKEQIGTFYVWGGAGGSSPKIIRAYPKIFWRLLYTQLFSLIFSSVVQHVHAGVTAGYGDEVIFADGTFIDGSTAELSADGPIRPPFVVYCQVKFGCMYLTTRRQCPVKLSSCNNESVFLFSTLHLCRAGRIGRTGP